AGLGFALVQLGDDSALSRRVPLPLYGREAGAEAAEFAFGPLAVERPVTVRAVARAFMAHRRSSNTRGGQSTPSATCRRRVAQHLTQPASSASPQTDPSPPHSQPSTSQTQSPSMSCATPSSSFLSRATRSRREAASARAASRSAPVRRNSAHAVMYPAAHFG